MSSTVFTFGQRGGFFVESVSARHSIYLPTNLQLLFDEKKVTQTYCLALGKGDSYAISYLGSDDFQHIQTRNLPPNLHKWLLEKDASNTLKRELKDLKISLGPHNESFFATDGVQHIWQNLPAGLDEALEERRLSNGNWKSSMQTPKIVALGAMENYLLITEGGGGSWILGHYKEMDAVVKIFGDKQKWSLIQNVALDPHRFQSSVALFANGTVLQSSHLPPHCDSILKAMIPTIQEDMENEVRQKAQAQAQAQRSEAQYAMLLSNLRAQQLAQQRQLLQLQQQANLNAYSQMVGAMLAMNLMDWSLNN